MSHRIAVAEYDRVPSEVGTIVPSVLGGGDHGVAEHLTIEALLARRFNSFTIVWPNYDDILPFGSASGYRVTIC